MRRIAITLGAALLASCASMAYEVHDVGVAYRLLRDDRASNNRVAVLLEDLVYCYPRTGDVIIVPAGYLTDFASVPRGVDAVLQEYGNNIEAAIVHDWLYAVGERDKRAYADDLFRYALQEQGVSLTDRWAKWFGVTAGGGRSYGSAQEWNGRFYDVGGQGPITPPFARPRSGIVTQVTDCRSVTSFEGSRALLEKYGSTTWPRA